MTRNQMHINSLQVDTLESKPAINDYFETAVANLRANCAALYGGGYYEPVSERDVLLAEGIADLLIKFKRHPFSGTDLC